MSWQCNTCGFNNKPQNEVCGGAGPIGCKSPKGAAAGAGGSFGAAKGKKGGGKGSPYGAGGGVDQWACSDCGFGNRAANEVCGGNGPMGCKKPRRGVTGGLPAAHKPIQSTFMQQFGKGKDAGGGGGKDGGGGKGGGYGKGDVWPGNWQCQMCGFGNKPQNEVCGGNGPMGCKSPAPGMGGGGGWEMQQAMMMKGKGFGDGGGSKGKGKGKWSCEMCGFGNGDRNEVCGGNGPMGCKAPKPYW